jgi:hypothetical protein
VTDAACVVGIDRVDQAGGMREHGADVSDLAEWLDAA